ncbi:MAG: nitrate reductase [Acidobacteriaceae bacterium]|nr:nitrate reductase [Acidobacteriaceae bacterium]
MCPPHHFGVEYVINPWMQGQVNAADQELACRQWMQFHSFMSNYADVALMPAVSGLPDLVFTANAALVYRQVAVLSSFRCMERQPEAQYYAEWLSSDGFRVETLPSGILFEGAGDALFDRGSNALLWFGYGFRSSETAVPHLKRSLDVEVQELRLRDPRFYHLDTCFCPLEGGYLLYYPAAFDGQANEVIQARVPADRRLVVSEEDAIHFACNAVNIGKKIILNYATRDLAARLTSHGFELIQTRMSEFMKAGGSTKCLSLRLNEV